MDKTDTKSIKYKFKNQNNLTGPAKISFMGEIRFLKKLDLEGFHYFGYNSNYHFFSIENQLSRRLKLSLMVDGVIPHKIKFLNDIIKRSEITDDIDSSFVLWTSEWYSYSYEDFNTIDEFKVKKEENKFRQNFHNNISKQRLRQTRK